MRDPLTISIGHQARSGVGWFVVMVGTILYNFPCHDDYMDGSNIDIFRRQSRRQSYMNQTTEKPTKHALMITGINHISACRYLAQLPNAHLLFRGLLRGRLIRSRRRTRLPSRDTLRRDDRRSRHRGKLHRLECRLLGELDIPAEIGMCGCNPFTVLIQKNHGSMVRVIAVRRRMRVSAIHVSWTRTSIQGEGI